MQKGDYFKVKKVYSLNLITFLMSRGFDPKIIREDGEDLYYAVFDDNTAFKSAIGEWKQEDLQVEIHKYLNCYKVLRETIKQMREG